MHGVKDVVAVYNLTVAYHDRIVLWNVTVSIGGGILVGVIGPNGAGKTTFLKAIINVIKPLSGIISILGKPLREQRELVAYVPQRISVDWDFPINVFDVVMMGRYSKIGLMRRPKKNDIDCVGQALQDVGLQDYAQCPINELSGGQQQRVFIARALVQDAHIYLLDEPFNGVDICTEKVIIDILKNLRNNGKTIIVVHHDFQTLGEYFDWLLLLNTSRIAYGPVDTILRPEYICSAYGERDLFKCRFF